MSTAVSSRGADLAASPEQALAEGFAHHVLRWARERNAPDHTLDALFEAAHAASFATASGHVCAHLADIAADTRLDEHELRTTLLASGMVGTPQAPDAQPLILDGDGRVYLHRYFDYERRLARRLTAASPIPSRVTGDNVKSLLDQLFAANADRLGKTPDWQKIATALALERRLTIISGGPGTGKTTTVVNVLAGAIAENPDCRIRLAAPTGKAAARMRDAIRNAAAHLPAELRERLPSESFTVHRLLGLLPAGDFRHDIDHPLPIDLLVVDEASMLDLSLATRLVEAVPTNARIILLGDKDQLAAVESGAVFSELSADPTLSSACTELLSEITGIPAARIVCAAPIKPTPLHDSVVWLTENFRFAKDSGIGRLAALVNAGEAQSAIDFLRSDSDPALEWIEDAHPAPQAATLQRIIDEMAGYIGAARADLGNKAALFDALGRFRVLCAEREGSRGVDAINQYVGQRFRRHLDHPLDPGGRSQWYPGRPVMVLRNDYVLKLFNGDVGIMLPDAAGTPMVFFPDSDGDFRAVSPLRLPEHETAFATTVHKAQGSEFDKVTLMLPAKPSRVATRELVYTAITRSRSGVTIVGGAEVVEKAIVSPTRRYSGLVARLGEEAPVSRRENR
ncbi:MAG: exodeoxyribonuclease V subunit alpha [Betaproteobacteria bacterium]|nr:exodeoxyribonuclease V subunit alpha [Betaproteobacteria bacterium]